MSKRDEVYQYAGSDLTLEEIGQLVGLTRERVRQIMPYHAAINALGREIKELVESELVGQETSENGLPEVCSRCGQIMTGVLRTTWKQGTGHGKCGRCSTPRDRHSGNVLRYKRKHVQVGVIAPDGVRCKGTTRINDRCRLLAVVCRWHREANQ